MQLHLNAHAVVGLEKSENKYLIGKKEVGLK